MTRGISRIFQKEGSGWGYEYCIREVSATTDCSIGVFQCFKIFLACLPFECWMLFSNSWHLALYPFILHVLLATKHKIVSCFIISSLSLQVIYGCIASQIFGGFRIPRKHAPTTLCLCSKICMQINSTINSSNYAQMI